MSSCWWSAHAQSSLHMCRSSAAALCLVITAQPGRAEHTERNIVLIQVSHRIKKLVLELMTHGRIHDFRVWNIPPSSKVVLHVKTQKNHKIFSQLSATLIVQHLSPILLWLLLECKKEFSCRHIDLTYYTLTRHYYYFQKTVNLCISYTKLLVRLSLTRNWDCVTSALDNCV